MHSLLAPVAIGIELLFLIIAAEGSRGPNKLQRDVPDAFKTMEAFDHPIALMDANNDSILECLSARRVDIDPRTKTATYIWSLAGDDGKGRKKVPFYHMPGDSPDVTLYTVGSKNSPVESGRILYTDYKNCGIAEFSHFGDQCTLWVPYEARDSIPTACREQYSDICGEAVSVNDIKACEDAYD